MNTVDILNAVGSIGTLVMAFFYFISVSIQLYQMRLGFYPALGFEQTFIVNENGKLKLQSAADLLRIGEEGINYFSLYNIGGGTAKNLSIRIYLNKNMVLQEKYVHILPGSESYLLPVNERVHKGLEEALVKDREDAELTIDIDYKSSIRQKWQHVSLVAQFDSFSDNDSRTIFEVQFVNADSESYNDNERK
ncbi:MAG: hypothetical protein L0L10_05880 [Tetragenococcus sp.]|nr:hypothetical protein [Tetragenococcus sp.]